MITRKTRLTTAAFVVLLALSGASYGFLLGRSHQLKSEAQDATEQLQTMGSQVKNTGAVVTKGLDAVRRMLIK